MAIETSAKTAPGDGSPAGPGPGGPAHARPSTSALTRLLLRPAGRCWVDGLVIFAVRAVSILLVGEFAVRGLGPLPDYTVSLFPHSRSLFDNFFHWDAVRYVQIAQHGYVHRYDSVYFPLYPLLVRVLPFADTAGALVVSWLATYLFLVALTYYLRHCLGLRRWSPVVLLAAFAPASFFYFAAYPEPLEALALVLVLILVHRQRPLAAAVVAGVSTAVAPICVFFALPIVVDLARRRRWLRAVASGVVAELGGAAYVLYLWQRFHSPLLFYSEESTPQWNRRLTYPFHGVVWSLDRILHGQLVGAPPYNGDAVMADVINDLATIGATVALVALVVHVWRRRDLDLLPGVAVTVVMFGFNVCDATAGGVSPEALARHLLVVVPLYLPLAYLRRTQLATAAVTGSAVLAVMAQTLYFHNLWFT